MFWMLATTDAWARAGKINKVATTPTRLPTVISATLRPAAISGSMCVVAPISMITAVTGAAFSEGLIETRNASSATVTHRITPPNSGQRVCR